MPSFQKISILVLKSIGGLLITASIIYFLSGQYQKENEAAFDALASMKQTMLSLMPDNEKLKTEQSEPSGKTVLESNSKDIKPEPPEKSKTIVPMGINDTGSKKVQKTSDTNLGSSQFTESPSKKQVHILSRKEIQKLSELSQKGEELRMAFDDEALLDSLEVMEYTLKLSSEFEADAFEELAKNHNINVTIKTFDGLISEALEVGLNETDIDYEKLDDFTDILENAEDYFDFEDISMSDIIHYTSRIALFTTLKEKMRLIGEKYPETEDCSYHVPQLKIDKDLRITGFYQYYDCHPEIVKKIMREITKLPEWKRLNKK